MQTLFHDDRDSFYALAEACGEAWSESLLSKEALLRKVEKGLEKGSAWYVSRNGFVATRRVASRTRQVNSFMLDIDAHGASSRSAAWMLAELDALVEEGAVPEPTMVVDSGRGIHVYYVLDRSISTRSSDGSENTSVLSWFSDLQDRLAVAFESRFCEFEGVDVDSAVYDLARVARIPGTFNPKAGKCAELVRSAGPFASLPGLSVALEPVFRKKKHAAARKNTPQKGFPLRAAQAARARKIERLQELRGRDCEGSRELMCFLYYNACVQAFPREEAVGMVYAFNARFSSPLPSYEVSCAVRSVDAVELSYGPDKGAKGYYPVSNKKVAELLSVTESENDEIGFFGMSSRALQRRKDKERTRERRASRNARIVELVTRLGMTRKAAAKAVGCSLRTVAYVLAEAKAQAGKLAEASVGTAPSRTVQKTALRIEDVSRRKVGRDGILSEQGFTEGGSVHSGFGKSYAVKGRLNLLDGGAALAGYFERGRGSFRASCGGVVVVAKKMKSSWLRSVSERHIAFPAKSLGYSSINGFRRYKPEPRPT